MNEYLNTEGGRRRRRARGVRGGRPHMQPDRPGTGWEESHIPHDDHAHGHGRRRRHRARRGAVRLAILALLAEEPLNGYQIIQRLNDRTGGVWNPSPGSVYPTLSQLSDEGLIETTEDDGKRVFALTSTGVEAAERVTVAPWDSIELFGERQHPEDDPLLFQLEQLGFAVRAAAATGDDVLIESAASLMAGVRRDIYSLLSEAAESQD